MWACGRAPVKAGPILIFPAYSHVDSHLVITIGVRGKPLGPDCQTGHPPQRRAESISVIVGPKLECGITAKVVGVTTCGSVKCHNLRVGMIVEN
jgi:hypothetical protein